MLEKQDKRLYADDTIPLSAKIAQYRTVDSHVVRHGLGVCFVFLPECVCIVRHVSIRLQEYEIRVHKLLSPEDEWTVKRCTHTNTHTNTNAVCMCAVIGRM